MWVREFCAESSVLIKERDVVLPMTALAAETEVAVKFPTITLADRIVVLADRTVMIEFADHEAVLTVVMTLASRRLADVLRSKSHCP